MFIKCDQFHGLICSSVIMKWKKMFESMIGLVSTHKNGLAPKGKWATMYGDYKRIWDYVVGTCQNDEYWNILPPNKVPLNLLKFSNKMIYKMIDAFMSNRLMFKPSQFQDFMDQNSNVYTCNFTC